MKTKLNTQENNMLVHYVHTPPKYEAKVAHKNRDIKDAVLVDVGSKRIGVIVAIGPGEIGWSLCNPLDKFDKKYGKQVAVARAEGYRENYEELLAKAPEKIREEIKCMYNRSLNYFK